jgi:hypothetical protein
MIRRTLFLLSLIFWSARRVGYALWLRLSMPRYVIQVERGLRVPARDGTVLVCDHYAPLDVSDAPTILVRSPYGRNHAENLYSTTIEWFITRFAERGYHVVVQDCRGRFDSGGTFEPFINEADDGLATVAWLRQQEWFNGTLGTWGPSYLGLVQWAIAGKVPELKAMMPIFTASRIEPILYPSGVLNYGLITRWMAMIALLDQYSALGQNRWRSVALPFETSRRADIAFRRLPMRDAITGVTGFEHHFTAMQDEFLNRDSNLWQRARSLANASTVTVPALLIAGWYDIFLDQQLRDYAELKANGANPHLVIGAWMHFSNWNGMQIGTTLGMRWFDHHLRGKPLLNGAAVQIFVMGQNRWRSLDDFPPPSTPRTLYLNGDSLSDTPPEQAQQRSYRYDPERPTPSYGGMAFTTDLQPIKDNRWLEARRDVLTFTSAPLVQHLETIGVITLDLFAHSSRPTTDYFARITDVYPDGRSMIVVDGFVHLADGADQGVQCVQIRFAATAYRFAAGHRLRLMIASGSYPNYARNFGTGEPPFDAQRGVAADQTIHSGGQALSCLHLPITAGE